MPSCNHIDHIISLNLFECISYDVLNDFHNWSHNRTEDNQTQLLHKYIHEIERGTINFKNGIPPPPFFG